MTIRAVGLAVSGGGATSYRIVALLENLEHRDVPIDVISGISGGALVGAYYCRKGHAGLEMCIARGPSFQRRILAALLDGSWFRHGIDCDLGYASVDDVDVRFVPVATALRDGQPPEARVISGGTLGEAVHASGAASGLFSPMCRDGADPPEEVIRYTDGVSSRLIPARAVAEYGADLVIAYNTIPTPERRNPFDDSCVGRWIYDKTVASRAIDFAVSWLFMLAQCSREVAEDAHHFIEPVEENEPFSTAFRFDRAAAIVNEARADMSLINAAKACADRWEEFWAAPAFPAYWTPPLPPPQRRKARKAKKKAPRARRKTHARKTASARKKRPAPKKSRRPKKPRPPKK
jgi:predicted acylesterase/phospholipase RssA